MSNYEAFAYLYATGDYPQYSQRIAEQVPKLFTLFKLKPQTVLDLACGEGSFAVAMAKQGFQVTGIDRSSPMLEYAKAKADREKVTISWRHQDMRDLDYQNEFDLVTCWFDSLNYLIELDDLCETFNRVQRALKDGGLFMFDMNTIFWLVTLAQRYACTVEKETADIFQIHRHSYDFERNIATFYITGFVQENGKWLRRIDEKHLERGYHLEEIQSCLQKAELKELACWGDLENRTAPSHDSRRVFFVSKK